MSLPNGTAELISLALLKLNQAPISSLTDTDSPAANAGLLVYDLARKALIRNYNWNFARRRGYATKSVGDGPKFDYTLFYDLPKECLKLVRVGELGEEIPYDKQGNKLLIDPNYVPYSTVTSEAIDLPIVYMADVEDPSEWDPLFTDTLVADIAHRICMPITGSREREKELEAEKIKRLAEAATINHQERPMEITEINYIDESRYFDGNVDLKVNPTVWDG